MTEITIREGSTTDMAAAAALRWEWLQGDEAFDVDLETYTAGFVTWAADNAHTHHLFIAVRDYAIVGMAWLAVGNRAPNRSMTRQAGDVQSVFVTPEASGAGIATALMRKLIEKAESLHLERLTVHASTLAIPMYQRAGFDYSKHLMQLVVAPQATSDAAARRNDPV